MKNIDSLKPDQKVTVSIYGPDDTCLYETTGTGYHSLEAAVNVAIRKAHLQINPEDCVFQVNNHATSVSHNYRLNAHSHLKLIV